MSETTTPPTGTEAGTLAEEIHQIGDRIWGRDADALKDELLAELGHAARRAEQLEAELDRARGAVHLASVWDSLAAALDAQADALETDAGCVARWMREKASAVRAALGTGGAA